LRGNTLSFTLKKRFWSGLQLVFGNIFKIKFVEMGKSAVPAPDGEVPAADGQVVRAGYMAVPASGRLHKFPEVITAYFNILSFFTDILDAGDKYSGCPAILADHLGLVRHGRDDLVGTFLTVIAGRTVPREDEPVTHER
jgi:hypothetical protein